MKSGLLSTLFLLTILFSCTVTKREHLSGYHIEWRNKLPKPEADNVRQDKETASRYEAIQAPEQEVPAEITGQLSVLPSDSIVQKSSVMPVQPEIEPSREKRPSFSTAFKAEWRKTVRHKVHVPQLKQQTGWYKQKMAERRPAGFFGRFLVVLLILCLFIPIILLLVLFGIALFKIQYLLWAILLFLILLIVLLKVIF
jgi:hypothetical protein